MLPKQWSVKDDLPSGWLLLVETLPLEPWTCAFSLSLRNEEANKYPLLLFFCSLWIHQLGLYIAVMMNHDEWQLCKLCRPPKFVWMRHIKFTGKRLATNNSGSNSRSLRLKYEKATAVFWKAFRKLFQIFFILFVCRAGLIERMRLLTRCIQMKPFAAECTAS